MTDKLTLKQSLIILYLSSLAACASSPEAPEGGSLAVQPSSSGEESEGFRLLEPHFRGRIEIAKDVAAAVPAGMRMQVSLGYRTEPIASRIRRTIRRLWHSAQDNAASH